VLGTWCLSADPFAIASSGSLKIRRYSSLALLALARSRPKYTRFLSAFAVATVNARAATNLQRGHELGITPRTGDLYGSAREYCEERLAAGLVGRMRVLDSTALYDAVATQDTETMIRSAIRKLLQKADSAGGAGRRACPRRLPPEAPNDAQPVAPVEVYGDASYGTADLASRTPLAHSTVATANADRRLVYFVRDRASARRASEEY